MQKQVTAHLKRKQLLLFVKTFYCFFAGEGGGAQ